jgi:hypothetical protein
MTKPKTWADLERSLDADWPPRQPITLTDLVAEARAVDWDFVTWCYVTGMTPASRMPVTCLNACWLMPESRAAPACIDRPTC